MNKLILSVVMPVYNGEAHLKEAIQSVLNQSFTDFELIIIDDGSVDTSASIVSEISDPRIRYIKNDCNKGISYSRNRGIKEAKGDFLAWMDCDDLISPNRFEIQLKFMTQNPSVGICGTWLTRFDSQSVNTAKSPADHNSIKALLLFKPAIWNATAINRLDWIKKAGLTFDERLTVAEDFDFYWKACREFPVANIPNALYQYRDSESSIMKSFDSKEEQSFAIHKIIYQRSLVELGIEVEEKHLRMHRNIGSTHLFDSTSEFKNAFYWLIYLQENNRKAKIYEPQALAKTLGQIFYFTGKKSSQAGLPVFFFYLKKRNLFTPMGFTPTLKLFIRCLIKYNRF
ncbi:glycosyltransferase family 2 protein [uncultured Cyclobacterium sp.]|uniref:glycosyltransferase family 2 protein n=1 Tax=uncultured Cyclobacterium sp. TaxID=453820 RepID=UPI0030ED7C4A